MCAPKNDGGSYNAANARFDSGAKFGLNLLTTGLNFFGNRSKVARNNELKRQQVLDRQNAQLFQEMVDGINWHSEILNHEAKADSEYLAAVNNIADNQLSTWNSLRDADNKTMALYAKMMSVGSGEQAGRRAGGTKVLDAVREFGRQMSELGAEVSGKTAELALKNRGLIESTRRKLNNEAIGVAMGKPIPAPLPQLHASALEKNDNPLKLMANIGTNYLQYRADKRELMPPDVNENSNRGSLGRTYEFDTTERDWGVESEIPESNLDPSIIFGGN